MSNTYQKNKEKARELAVIWQLQFNDNNYSYEEIADWQFFFEEIGRKYGLLREFRENGVI